MTKKKIKVPINSRLLYELIEARTSIRQLGPTIGYNEKTIRRGLKEKEMSFELIILIGQKIEVDPKLFANFDEYYKSIYVLQKRKES